MLGALHLGRLVERQADAVGKVRGHGPAASAGVQRRRAWVISSGTSLSIHSRLQLAFELVQEAPIRAIRNDLLRTVFYHAQFVQPQRIEA
jgi:hypothetical protein